MSSESEIDLLLFDGSNYMSWCKCMLSLLKAIDPVLVSITDVSIYPPNFSWDNCSDEQRKCAQRNAHATNLLMGYLSSDLDMALYNEFGFLKDAHVLKILEAKFLKKTSIQDNF